MGYLNDLLLKEQSVQTALADVQQTVQILQRFGHILNIQKSSIDMILPRVFFPPEKNLSVGFHVLTLYSWSLPTICFCVRDEALIVANCKAVLYA